MSLNTKVRYFVKLSTLDKNQTDRIILFLNQDNPSQPVELLDPWKGPETYAQDFYSGGDILSSGADLSVDQLSALDSPDTPNDNPIAPADEDKSEVDVRHLGHGHDLPVREQTQEREDDDSPQLLQTHEMDERLGTFSRSILAI